MNNYTNYMMPSNAYMDDVYMRRRMEDLNRIINAPQYSFSDVSKKTPSLEEKWVWVTGYKGTDKDMKCMNDFQYEIGKTYDMPEDSSVKACQSGFHMCLELEHVFKYKDIGHGNRFFEVRALVRESDLTKYGKREYFVASDKLAAKSIELLRELGADEILAHIPVAAGWSDEIKTIAIEKGIDEARTEAKVRELITMGYSPELARYICSQAGYALAVALDTQPGISMDTKIMAIFSHV